MTIRQLFSVDRDPTRPLNEVISAEADIDVRSEIDEYVFTPHTTDYLRTLVEGVLDTAQGHSPDCLRGWISGFFGSGKSHFLKLSAALLSNRPVRLSDGTERGALEYAARTRDLDLPWQRLAAEFRIRAVSINLATAFGGGKMAQEKPLLFRLAVELNKAAGYSGVPHVAAIERELQRGKKWEPFLAAVRTQNQEWSDLDDAGLPKEWKSLAIRDSPSEAHRVLEAVLPLVLPKVTNPRTYLNDREADQLSPDAVVQLALDLASSLHPDMGRVLLCIDEVALYLRGKGGGFDGDRIREIQGLAEAVKDKGRSKVFLFATAQLRVDTIDSDFSGLSGYVVFLKDRFPSGGRLQLEERDIDTVIRERWLKKDPSSPVLPELQRLVNEHGGLLANAARLRDENLLKDTAPLTDASSIVDYYPCLPHHVRLLQSILEALRGERQIDQTAAQNRAILTTIRSLFMPQNGAGLADADVGVLVTFDRIYDVIRDVVRKADSPTDRWITETIDSLGAIDGVRVSAVAKVVFLLQHLNPKASTRVRVSAENVAALLYPRLGAPWERHLSAVRAALTKLFDEHFIGEEPESGFRFYRAEEQSFQKDVAAQPVDEGALRKLLEEAARQVVERLGLGSVTVAASHKLPVEVVVHSGTHRLPDPEAKATQVQLHIVWQRTEAPSSHIKLWAAQYAASPHVLVWSLPSSTEAEDLGRRALKLESALAAYGKRLGFNALEFLGEEKTRLDNLKNEALPAVAAAALRAGTLVHHGVDTSLTGAPRPASDIIQASLRNAVEQVYPQLSDGCVPLDDAALRKVFSWRSPQPQPDAISKLKLFDAHGQILVDRAFLSEIVLGLKGRSEADRTGKAILERFAASPYGWPERAVKAGLGALLRGRRLTVRLADGTLLRSEADPKAEAWLTATQLFSKSIFDLSDLNVTADERATLTRLFATALDRPGLDTMEKLEKEGVQALGEWLAVAREAAADLGGRDLPGARAASDVATLVETEADAPAGKLKDFLAKAKALGSDPAAALKERVQVVNATTALRKKGRLDKLAAVKARAKTLYAGFEGSGDLVKQVASPTLLLSPDEVLESDARTFAAYAREYAARHAARGTRVAEAIVHLLSHPAWSTTEEAQQLALLAPIRSLDCAGTGDLTLASSPDGRCPSCSASLAELVSQLELVEAREEKASRALDARLAQASSALAVSTSPIRIVLSSAEEIPVLLEAVDSAAKAALAKGGAIEVRVSIQEPGQA